GEHGDIFAFLMKTEGLSFADAVEKLAVEAGVPMPASLNKVVAVSPSKTAPTYLLPLKLPKILKRLTYEYSREKRDDLHAIVSKGKPEVDEAIEVNAGWV